MGDQRTLLDWMSDEEHRLRKALEPVSLVVESNFTAESIREAQRRYGARARAMLSGGHRYQDVIRKYPALTLNVMVGHAALSYDHGAYWDEFWTELGMVKDSNFENSLRQHLFPLLNNLKLARFPLLERQHQYVMTMAMHAGIPAHCLDDLLRTIDRHLVQGREARGAVLLEWLDEPGKQYRLESLDVPVRNFLRYGGEFAVDILDRVIEVVDSAVVDPTLLDSGLDTSTTGLPTVMLDELVQQLRENPVEWRGKRASGGHVERRPALAYSVDDDQLMVSIPYPRTDSDVPWRVSFDGDVHEVYAERIWGATEESHPPMLVPVPAPVREILMWHTPSDANFALRVVDKSDPLLTFTADGVFIPLRDGLKGAVWAVHPADSELFDPQSKRPVDVTEGSGSPWRGWRSTYVELNGIDGLQIRRGGSPTGTVRTVRSDAVARFEVGEALIGCRTADGRAVHPGRPWVMLPPSTQPTAWKVRTRRFGDREWIADADWNSEDVETCVDPFDDAEHGQLGLFEIVVTGPLGADVRAVMFLAEGLVVDFDTGFRMPAAGGLTPCIAELGSDTESSLTVGDESIEFRPQDLERFTEVSNGAEPVRLSIRPPHIEIRTGLAGTPSAWRTTADLCSPDSLAENRYVAVRIPGAAHVFFGFEDGAGQKVQFEPSRNKPGGVFEVPTQKFVDSAQRAGVGRLIAHVVVEGVKVKFAALAVRPSKLCHGVRLIDGQLSFDGLLTSDDLAVHVWCATAPWLPVQSIAIDGGTAQLPADLTDVGELRCQVFVDDPWLTVQPPLWPEPGSFRVAQRGWVASDDPDRTALSKFLAVPDSVPDSVGALPEVWSALTLLASDRADGDAQETYSALIEMLGSEPRRAFEGLGNSTISLDEKMGMLVRAKLVNQAFASDFTGNELHADPWFGCMVEISDLPSLYLRRDEVAEERAETLAYLRDKGGDLLLDTLRSGKAARLSEGCFDANVYRLDAMPPEQVEELLVGLRLVPGSLLDPDTRVAGNVAAFGRRSDWIRHGWSHAFQTQTATALPPLKRACSAAHELIAARQEAIRGVSVSTHPWMLMSVQSLTLALLARLEAHGRIEEAYLTTAVVDAWAELATLCPRLIATDLLIAEALVTHERHGDLIGDGS